MPLNIGSRINSNDVAVKTDIPLNSSTSTMVKAASTSVDFIYLRIENPNNQGVWVKLQAASVDDNKDWFFVPRLTFWPMPKGNLYLGEISAIADSGTPTIQLIIY